MLFFVVHQYNSGLGRLSVNVVKVSRSQARTHTHTHTHRVRLLWKSGQIVAEAATYTTHNKHNNEHPWPQQDTNLRFQQLSGFRTTP